MTHWREALENVLGAAKNEQSGGINSHVAIETKRPPDLSYAPLSLTGPYPVLSLNPSPSLAPHFVRICDLCCCNPTF